MGLIFYSSSQPYQNQDIKPLLQNRFDFTFLEPAVENIAFTYHQTEISVANLGLLRFIEFFIRKGAHVAVFFVLACLFYYAFRKTFPHWGDLNLAWAFVSTVTYAGLDEWHQGFTPNRTAYWGDVVLDAFGALIAVIVIYLWLTWKKSRKTR